MKQKSFSIWRYLKRHTKKIVLSCILMSISSVCSFILPSIMSEILDQGVTFASEETFPQIITNCLWMLGFSVINIGVSLLSAYISIIVTNSFTKDIEDDIFNTVNHMSFEEVNHFGIGTLITRTTHDIGTISWVANMMTGTIFIIPILFIAGVVMCFLKDVQLAIIILLCLPLIILFIALLSKKILPLWDLSEKYCDLQNDSVRERLRGIRVIRAFNNEPKEQVKIEKATHLMAENIIKANVSECIVDPFARLLIYIAIILVIFVGGVRIQNTGKLSAGDIFAIIQYIYIGCAAW